MASSAIDGDGKCIEFHWDFLDAIEAPMWADLSLCNLTNEEIDDPWFHISHPFHQCSSSELISFKEGGSNSMSTQEPPSPQLPLSVSQSRGKNYKVKVTRQNPSPVKKSNQKFSGAAGSSNTSKPIYRTGKLKEIEGPKASFSCESGITDSSRPRFSKHRSSYLATQEQEQQSSSMSTITSDHNNHQKKKGLEVSSQTSGQTSGLLSSLRINLRKSCATRPAARGVVHGGRHSEGGNCSSKSSVGSSMNQGSVGKKLTPGDTQKKARTPDSVNVTRISQPPRSKLKAPTVTKALALNVQDFAKRQGNNTLASKVTAKGKIQQNTSCGKVLMPRKVNEQHQMINKEIKKVGITKCPASVMSIKVTASTTMATSQRSKSSDKAAQSTGHVQKASKNGSKKIIGLKELTNQVRDKKTANPARKVYFR